ncbi:MAG: ubiquitin-like domain-containing protein, partial [Anaerolineales bacterium]
MKLIGLYQPVNHGRRVRAVIAVLSFILITAAGCGMLEVTGEDISVTISADGNTQTLVVPAGTSAEGALELAGVAINPLDKSTPALYTILQAGDTVSLVRVVEEYLVEESVIP